MSFRKTLVCQLTFWNSALVRYGRIYATALKNQHMQQNTSDRNNANEAANKSYGPQGVDKAPGEETPQDAVEFTKEAFKGKKVDGDPSRESDKPASQQDL